MTTGDRLRRYMDSRQFDGGELRSFVVRYWPAILIVALVALAAGLRLWDLGGRSIHHDESIHIKFAWDIVQGGAYNHDPVYHGPFQYYGTAATFFIFGDSDYTSRLFPALFGIALVGLPFLLRRQIGTLGAVLAAGLLAVSPALIYFSRFARNDMYVAFFTLAIAVCIWRYMEERKDGWLIAIAPLLALSFAAKEVTYIIIAMLLVYLNIMVAMELVARLRASREMTPVQTALSYAVLLPTAWLVTALWAIIPGLRRRFSTETEEMPVVGPLLIIFGTLIAAQFAAGIQALPFIDNNGYMGEETVMRWTVLILILGGAYVGLLWNWRTWLIAGLLFYGVFVLLFTSFFSNMGGFWTGIWGSMDYWLDQQDVRRGGQPDYYYFMLLPVYEFLPLIFGIGGSLYYAFRGKLEERLLLGASLLLIVTLSVIPDSTAIIGDFRIQIAFIVAIGTVLMLSIDGFTKFLLFWSLSIMFGLTLAGEKMPWLTVHLALPLALLGAKILDQILSSVKLTLAGEGRSGRISASIVRQPIALFASAGALATGAAIIFQAVGATAGLSALAWLLALAALAVLIWAGSQVSWQTAGQTAAVALFAGLLVFTIRAGGTAAFDQGDANGVPPEFFIYAQGSPALGVLADNIDTVARESGRGKDLKIVIDNSGNIWPWPWYMRDYTNVEYTNFDDDYQVQPGSVVLIGTGNQDKIQPYLDQFQEGIPYTHMWWFPELYKGLDTNGFLSDAFTGKLLGTWREYLIDRVVANATSTPNMIAFFPKEFDIQVPRPQPRAGDSTPLPAESVTVIGGAGAEPGQFSQPAGLAIDAAGNLYVADTLNQRVQRIAPDGTIDTLGEAGSGPGQFANPGSDEFAEDGPWGITVDSDGNIYVADTWNHRIQKFDANLEIVADWSIDGLFGPRDIAIDANGDLILTDTGGNRIVRYTTDGEIIRSFGVPGDGRGEFSEPVGVSIAPNGDIYIADYWNQRIQHYDSELLFADEIDVPSWGSQGVTDRAYIAALDDGTVLATDPANGRIVVFSPAGEEVAAWSLPSATGISRPVGIVVDGEGNVYVSDGLNSTVVRIPLQALLPPSLETP
ncbi:MAG: TIGR03663 family protein [Chloroflexi bacterium]|nr:TIGR03663 family protein [Chloroflexota bacterium]